MNDDAARCRVAMQRVKKLRAENERLRKLLFKIENHYELSADGDDDTQEAFEFRELVCRFKNEVEYGC